MKSFEQNRNLIEELSKLVEQTRLREDAHSTIFSKLLSLSKHLENSTSSNDFKSLSNSKISEILEASKLLSSKKILADTNSYELQISKLSSTYSLNILKEFQINQEYLQKQLNSVSNFSFNKEVDTWQKLIELNQNLLQPFQLEVPIALTVWDSSLTKVARQFQEFKLFQNKPILAERLLDFSKVYTDFVGKTIKCIEINTNIKVIKALQVSLHLTETQLLSATDILSNIAVVPEDDELLSSPGSLNLLDVQQEELIAIVKTGDEDEQSLIDSSSTAKLSADTVAVLQLITKCNEVSKIHGQPDIFKPTTRILVAYTALPWIVATDKENFANVVDHLYFIFYEGAGSKNLRFLSSNGGVLDKHDCEFIWCIKHLRNKWFRHDVDHGKQADIEESWKELSAKLRWLGLNYYPTSEKHYQGLHHRLIKEAKMFLDKIFNRLINRKI